jgi:hypothetical protein
MSEAARARIILRASGLASLLLSLISGSNAMSWINIGREASFALAFGLALSSLGLFLSSRWLLRRGLAL